MEIRFYTPQTINPAEDSGVIDIKSAPLLENAAGPNFGLQGYHKASSLSLAMKKSIIEAVKAKHVVAIVELTVSNLRSEDNTGRKINIASMKPDEVPHCELIHLGRLSASLRQRIVDIFKTHATTAEQKVKLANITNDRPFQEYIKLYPSVVDRLHEHPDFEHMRAIIFPSGPQDQTEFMVALYKTDVQNVSIKMIGAIKDVEFAVPSEYLVKPLNSELSSNNTPSYKTI